MEITLTAETYDETVNKSTLPVIIDFWVSWCGPCQMLAPVIAEIAEEYAGKIKVCKVNVDEQEALADKFAVSAIPMVALIENGKTKATSLGYKTKDALLKELGI